MNTTKEKTFKLEFSIADINTISNALAEMPYKIVAATMNKFITQVQPQEEEYIKAEKIIAQKEDLKIVEKDEKKP